LTACEYCGGACCKEFLLPKGMFGEDFERWLGYHANRNDEIMGFGLGCRMLHDGKCSIYKNRPKMCVEFPVGSRACREAIKTYEPDKYPKLVEMFK
jgi:Fe-S-cluster containining protein